jgi:hypothetical protein
VNEEWCLIARLDGDEAEIVELVSRAVEELVYVERVTRDGALVRVYSISEPVAARAEDELLALIEETSLGYEVWQERWNAEHGEWEELAPEGDEAQASGEDEEAVAASAQESSSLPDDEPSLDPESVPGMGERRRGCWVVKTELPDAESAEAFLEALRSRGAHAGRVGHKVGLLVADSGTAASVQAAIEALAPAGSSVTAQEASRVERVAYGAS